MPKVLRWGAAIAARVLRALCGTAERLKDELFANGYVIVRLPDEHEGQKLWMDATAAQRCRNWMKSQLPGKAGGAALVTTNFQRKPEGGKVDDKSRVMGVRTDELT